MGFARIFVITIQNKHVCDIVTELPVWVVCSFAQGVARSIFARNPGVCVHLHRHDSCLDIKVAVHIHAPAIPTMARAIREPTAFDCLPFVAFITASPGLG